MRFPVSLLLIAVVFLACSPLYACADKPYTCYYTLTASSPVDDPSTASIEAGPGMPITVEADVSGSYSGPISITLPSLDANLQYVLKHDGVVVDTKKDSYPVNSMRIEPGRTYSQTGSRSYALPSDLAPGDYTLVCAASISVFGLSRTEHASFPVKVIGDAKLSAASGPELAGVAGTPALGATIESYDMWHFPILGTARGGQS